MAIGDVEPVAAVPDTHYVDTGMYDTAGYGAVYVIDAERPALLETGIGTNREQVLAAIDAVGLDLTDIEVIALTHVHLDHAGGAGFLTAECPNATVYVHEIGAPHLSDPGRLWEGTKSAVGEQIQYYVEPKPIPDKRIVELGDRDDIDLGNRMLRAHHAPGHAPHQVVYHAPAAEAVFTGDAAGIYVPDLDIVYPTSPPPNFDLEQALEDVAMLEELAPETLCYTHFGPVSADGMLAPYARRLSDWVALVRQANEVFDAVDSVVDRILAESDALETVWGAEKARGEVSLNVRGVLAADT